MALRFLLILAVATCALAPGGCGRAGGGSPPAATPGDAKAVRVVALSPAIAVTLADLGLADRIVARHAYDNFSNPALPVVGDQSGIDYESLVRVNPTHVLLEWGSRDPPPRLTALAASRGWTVRTFKLLTLADIRSATGELAALVGGPDAAAAAERLVREMDHAWAPRPGLGVRVGTTLTLYWTDPVGAAGPGSFHEQILRGLGVRPADVGRSPYAVLDPETVRRMDPDTILLIMPDADVRDPAALLGPLSHMDLRAVRERRVAVVTDRFGQTPCSRLGGVAEAMADALQGLPPVESGADPTVP